MDGLCRTCCNALTTQTTLVEVNVRNIVLNSDSLKLTLLNTFAATDTSCLTCLHGNRTLVLVHAANEYTAILRTLLAKFDDVTWTSLSTCTAGSTLIVINFRKTCLRVHVDSIELTGSDTVATAKTAETTRCFTSATTIHYGTSHQTIVRCNAWTVLARTITTNDSDHWVSISNSHTQKICNLTHYIGSSHRTKKSVERTLVSSLYQGVSHS